MTYPISETFYSIQGEGTWAGTPMYFIRMAGCNVGKYETPILPNYLPGQAFEDLGHDEAGKLTPSPFQILHPEYATCTSFSGETFICDTDYRKKTAPTSEFLQSCITHSGAHHVSITGGEPLIHKDLRHLIDTVQALPQVQMVHLETSGTLPLSTLGEDDSLYITCSPKLGFLKENVDYVNQFKFLMRGPRDEAAIKTFLLENEISRWVDIYIQPVEEMGEGIGAYDTFVADCVMRHPEWKVSLQLHKILRLR